MLSLESHTEFIYIYPLVSNLNWLRVDNSKIVFPKLSHWNKFRYGVGMIVGSKEGYSYGKSLESTRR